MDNISARIISSSIGFGLIISTVILSSHLGHHDSYSNSPNQSAVPACQDFSGPTGPGWLIMYLDGKKESETQVSNADVCTQSDGSSYFTIIPVNGMGYHIYVAPGVDRHYMMCPVKDCKGG